MSYMMTKARLAAFAAIMVMVSGVSASPNFVDNNTPLPGSKTDRFPPTNVSQQWTASDANFVFGALGDLRTVVQRTRVNVKAFGATGDGTHDDTGAFISAINAAAQNANNPSDPNDAFGGIIDVPKGVYIVQPDSIKIPNGVGLRGVGTTGTIIRQKTGTSGASLVTNFDHTGGQEFAFLESLSVDGNGQTQSTAVVDWNSLFVNTYIRDVLIKNGSSVGLHVSAANAAGPVLIENVWVVNNGGHGVLIEELPGNTQAMNGIVAVNLTSEHQGTGASAIYLKGLGHAAGWQFHNTHIEMGGSATSRTGITVDGVSFLTIDGVQLLTSNSATIVAGVFITNSSQNVGIQVRNVTNANLINPILSDAKNVVVVGAVNLPWYVTSDVSIRGALRFTPYTTAGSQSLVAQDSSGTDRFWLNQSGQVTGSTLNGGALEIVGDATNNRPLVFVPSVVSGLSNIYGYYYPGGGGGVLRERSFTGGQDVRQIGTDGSQFFYQPLTVQGSATFQGKVVASGGSAPTISSCGTGPSVTAGSTDFSGSFTTGTVATSCTVTFSSAFAAAPVCTVLGSGAVVPTYNESTTAITMTVDVAATKYRYTCVGH